MPEEDAPYDLEVTQLGWGKVNEAISVSHKLRKLHTNVISNAKCQRSWRPISIKDYELCTLHKNSIGNGGCDVSLLFTNIYFI